MNTRDLARELGLLEIVAVEKRPVNIYGAQPFDYLLVLDFEATCWEKGDKNKGNFEIIEFPTVLLDVGRNEIVEEFSQYVMPMERHILSDFCVQFTGISQSQVDNGVPLPTCIMLFMDWLNEQSRKYGLVFPNMPSAVGKKCVFVTWSNWDLKICLKKECRRKMIRKSDVFDTWIDLRALYMEHFNRRPKGLSGALTEVGLKFEGREHCGLHDAKNTAYLAGKMMSDGVLMRITS